MFKSRGRFLVGALFVMALIGLLGSLAFGGAAMAYRMGRLSAVESDDADTAKEMPYGFGPGASHLRRRAIGRGGHFFGFTPLLYGVRLLFRVGLLVLVLVLIGGACRFRKHAFAGKRHHLHCAGYKHHFHGPVPPECCRDEAAQKGGTAPSDDAESEDETKLVNIRKEI